VSLKGVARVDFSGATGICTAHRNPVSWGGTFRVASGGFLVDGKEAVAVGDEGNTSCGHTFRASGGSSILTGVGGKVIAREGDPVIVVQGGYGTIVDGSPNVVSE
jgi:hypothetical protein